MLTHCNIGRRISSPFIPGFIMHGKLIMLKRWPFSIIKMKRMHDQFTKLATVAYWKENCCVIDK